MVFQNNVLAGGAGGSGTDTYAIDQSIRFNADDSPYMSRTFGTATDANKWTLSVWSKLGKTGNGMRFLEAGGSAGNEDFVGFGGTAGNEKLYFWKRTSSSYNYNLTSTQLFRDHSAFYHLVYVFDSSNTLSTERMKAYVNGQRITDFSTETYPSSGYASRINTAVAHRIGEPVYGGGHSDGYVAEMVFIDGQALDPSSFAEENENGIWIPKDVSGLTFGTNGFHIDGRDSADLGDDESGNGNDFTTSGLAAHDQVADSPTNNFCVLSQINMGSATGVTLRDGNLDGRTSGTAGNAPASISLDSGKWYWEVNNHDNGSGNTFGAGETPTGSFHHFTLGSDGNQINTNSVTVSSLSSGTIIGFKLDLDAGTLQHTTNGSSYTSTGSLTANTAYAPYSRLGSSSGRVVFNFGQDSTFGGLETAGSNSDGNGVGDFKYSVPSGFLAICTKNLGS